MNWAHMIDALSAGQPLSGSESEALFSAMFDGGVPDLELGGLLALLEQRHILPQEASGALAALSTRVFQISPPDTQWRPVLMPSYCALREHPNLAPLLAISLQRLGIPVLVHGTLSGERGVAAAYIYRELGIMPCASLAQAQEELNHGHLTFVPTGALAPALADLMALRVRVGGGALARLLARLADPFAAAGLQLVPAENAHERAALRELLCDAQKNALLFETRDGDPVVDALCRPEIELIRDGAVLKLFDTEVTPRCAHPLPAAHDLKGTARWISGVLEGRIPMPVPIANQFACCLYGAGYAQDLNQAKAIAAVETGSLAAA
ncbi:MAG: DNA-binding protein YbiB [Betaproteobacteria bacterium]|nr:DNA-binding protein YbiB [Betaproteobacteria bacterium]MDH5342197.1 DNA-binding protein YbiB [Betaproteobacteria bacterium]